MNVLAQTQLDHNALAFDQWDAFADHRGRIMGALNARAGAGRSRLCVLGAGNCTDLDLRALSVSYREVHLVDLDVNALARGIARQGMPGNLAIHPYAPMDVTGLLDDMAGWPSGAPIGPAELDACLERPRVHVGSTLPGPFDVVASTCLLSQLMGSVVQAVGETHPRLADLVQAVRGGHFRLLMDLTAPGGTGMLITDVVSSDTAPELSSVAEADLPALLERLIANHNFFHGVNPAACAAQFRSDPVLHARVAELAMSRPWLWKLGARRYAVCAIKVRRGD